MAFEERIVKEREANEKISTSSIRETLAKKRVLSNLLIAEALHDVAIAICNHWRR